MTTITWSSVRPCPSWLTNAPSPLKLGILPPVNDVRSNGVYCARALLDILEEPPLLKSIVKE